MFNISKLKEDRERKAAAKKAEKKAQKEAERLQKEKDTEESNRQRLIEKGIPVAYDSSLPGTINGRSKFAEYGDYAQKLTNSRFGAIRKPENPLEPNNNYNNYNGMNNNGMNNNMNNNMNGNMNGNNNNINGNMNGRNGNMNGNINGYNNYNNRYNNNNYVPTGVDDQINAAQTKHRYLNYYGGENNLSPYAKAAAQRDSQNNRNNPGDDDFNKKKNELFQTSNPPQELSRNNDTNETDDSFLLDDVEDNGIGESVEVNDNSESQNYSKFSSNKFADDDDYDENASENEDVENIKSQMKFTKQASIASTFNSLRLADEAEASALNTLGMLGSQSERMHNTNRTLQLAEAQTKVGEEKARELKNLNRSLFAIRASNPFSSKKRLQERENKMRNELRRGQIDREMNRKDAYQSAATLSSAITNPETRALTRKYRPRPGDRDKYQFEADEEDEELENTIDDNLNKLSQASTRLRALANTASEELDKQNAKLDKIAEDTDNLDVNVHLNTARLARIH